MQLAKEAFRQFKTHSMRCKTEGIVKILDAHEDCFCWTVRHVTPTTRAVARLSISFFQCNSYAFASHEGHADPNPTSNDKDTFLKQQCSRNLHPIAPRTQRRILTKQQSNMRVRFRAAKISTRMVSIPTNCLSKRMFHLTGHKWMGNPLLGPWGRTCEEGQGRHQGKGRPRLSSH